MSIPLFFLYLLATHVLFANAGKKNIIEFNITSKFLDGRRILSINEELDTYGPTIRVRSGEELRLKVINNICTDAEIERMDAEPDLKAYCETAVHFHGIINVGNEFDGVPYVTQNPIEAGGGVYWYNFTIPSDLCGTYWYHSHSSVQYGDGLRGAMIIDCDEYDLAVNELISNLDHHDISNVDGLLTIEEELISKNKLAFEEQIVTLSDWYNTWNFDINRHTVINSGGSSDPRLDDSLINGKKEKEQAVIIHDHRDYLLFRFINSGMSGTQVVNFPGYKMVVFETDGVMIKPFVLETLSMAVGQRYSVILKKEPNAVIRLVNGCNKMMGYFSKQVWYIPKIKSEGFEAEPNQIPPIKGLPGLDKHEKYRSFQPISRDDAIYQNSVATSANLTVELDYNYYRDDSTITRYGTGMFLMNGKSLAEYLEDPIQLPEEPGATVDIIINSIEHMRHPWHMHGHRFQVISMGQGGEGKLEQGNTRAYSKYEEDLKYWEDHPTEIPMTRDSINIPGRSFAVLRIKTKDRGKWLLHCHVEWHVSKGLGVLFETRGVILPPVKSGKKKVLAIYAILMVFIDIALYYLIMR